MSSDPEALHCARHPEVETYLRCGRCEVAICPRCLVQTPVGARCRDCARLRRLPTYDVPPRFLARGGAAGLAAATLGSMVAHVLPSFGLFLLLLLGAGYGTLVAMAVSAATNHKRGSSLAWVTVGVLVVGFVVGRAALVFLRLDLLPAAARLTRAITVGFSPELPWILFLLIAAVLAHNRLR